MQSESWENSKSRTFIFSVSIAEGYCPSETVGIFKAFGIFNWSKTLVGINSTLSCPHNKESIASRKCLRTNLTESGGIWGPIFVDRCHYRDVRSKELFLLAQVHINQSKVFAICCAIVQEGGSHLKFRAGARTLIGGYIFIYSGSAD